MAKAKTEIVLPPGRLWPDTPWGSPMEIEIFGATGEFSTGKTILGLSIAPGVHPTGHPFEGQPRTLYLDLEKSGTSYAGTGCRRIDVPAELTKAYGANYTSRQAAEWFNAVPSRVKPGQYDVCMVDPINDVEAGEVDLVKANPQAYGYTKGQIDNSTPLLMAAMKAHYKKLLMGFSTVFKCLYFTTHLRDEFKGGKPTSRREPRGKETLAELASLYLWLERLPDDKGGTSAAPSAIVLKHRLSDTRVNEAGELEVIELMPRRIPVATVQAIRRYIANPPNIEKPAAGERVIEKPVTEIELQQTRLAVAEAEAQAANARAALLDRQKELYAIRQASQVSQPNPAPAVGARVAPAAEKQEADPAAAEEAARLAASQEEGRRLAAAATGEHATAHQSQAAVSKTATATPTEGGTINDRVEHFKTVVAASGVSPEKLKLAFSLRNAERFTQLTQANQDEILAWLDDVAACQQLIQDLGLEEAKIQELCTRASVKRIGDLIGPLAASLRATLQKALDARRQQPPKN